jgi:hypothetical protein
MARILAAIAVWLVLVGGTGLYLRQHEARAASGEAAPEAPLAAGYRVELTPTFAAAPDPFALQLDAAATAPALVVRLNGTEILRRADNVVAGEVIVLEEIPPVAEGANELFVDAAPTGDAALQSHALRVRVMRGAETIADETVWSVPGAALSGGVTFTAHVATEAAHDH